MTATVSALDRLADSARELYTLPSVAAEVLRLTSDPKVDVRLLKECLENDPALTSRLLRVVNSSLFGLSRQVTNLNQALALLGIKPLKLLVLGFSLPRGLFGEIEANVLSRFWHHALVKAVAAREIADAMAPRVADESFLVGLLQDIGELVLIQQLGEPYLQFSAQVEAEGGQRLSWQRETLGFDHTELTVRLLTRWGLPNVLVEAVAAQPDGASPGVDGSGGNDSGANLSSSDEWSPRRIVCVAEEIAVLLADERPTALDRFLRRLRSQQGFIPFDLESAVLRIQKTVKQLAEVLSLELPDARDYSQLLADGQARLAAVAADVAGDMVRADVERLNGPVATSKEVLALTHAVERYTPRRPGTAKVPATSSNAPRSTSSRSGEFGGVENVPAAETPPTDDPALRCRLTKMVATCRQQRASLSLLLAEIDHYDEMMFSLGREAALALLERTTQLCSEIDHPQAAHFTVSEARFAVLLPDCDRATAVRLGNALIDSLDELASEDGASRADRVTLSVGVASVAVPSKNFAANELIVRADRCLSAARTSGGGAVKSIEIC